MPRPSDRQIIAEHKYTLTRGEVRHLLREFGWEGTEDQIMAFAHASLGSRASVLDSADEESYGGIDGMTLRWLIDQGDLPVTQKARDELYATSDQPPIHTEKPPRLLGPVPRLKPGQKYSEFPTHVAVPSFDEPEVDAFGDWTWNHSCSWRGGQTRNITDAMYCRDCGEPRPADNVPKNS